MSENNNEVKRITKADILGGGNNVTYIYFEDLGGELPLGSLTDGQVAQIDAVKGRGSTMGGSPYIDKKTGNPDSKKSNLTLNINLEKAAEAEYEADVLAVFYGLRFDERIMVDEIKKFKPAGIVKKIAAEVYKITGYDPKKKRMTEATVKDVKRFRD